MTEPSVVEVRIEEVAELPPGFDALLAESRAEGWRFLHRLDQELRLVGPPFSAARGSLFAARRGDELLGVCVLCRDPFLDDPEVGRLRHLYVAAAARRRGVGRRLVGEVVQRARLHFRRVRLRTEAAEAGSFYVALGFASTAEEGATHELILTHGPPISLRPPVESDAESVFEAVRESMAELEPWMDWCVPGYSLADARSWALENGESRANGSAYSFLVVDARACVLGVVGLNQINQGNGFANLGYWVRTSEAGRGIAARAVRQLEKWAFAETALRRLELVIAVGNARSQRVAEKAGATLEGTLRARLCIHGVQRDAYMYSIVKPSDPA